MKNDIPEEVNQHPSFGPVSIARTPQTASSCSSITISHFHLCPSSSSPSPKIDLDQILAVLSHDPLINFCLFEEYCNVDTFSACPIKTCLGSGSSCSSPLREVREWRRITEEFPPDAIYSSFIVSLRDEMYREKTYLHRRERECALGNLHMLHDHLISLVGDMKTVISSSFSL